MLGLGFVAAVLTVVFIGVLLSGDRACPAIGFVYVGDAELNFSVQPQSASACFGEGCTPKSIVPRDGKWLVPQSPPYLVPPAEVTSIYVEAVTASGARMIHRPPIETESSGERPYGRHCPGPSKFKAVQVPLD